MSPSRNDSTPALVGAPPSYPAQRQPRARRFYLIGRDADGVPVRSGNHDSRGRIELLIEMARLRRLGWRVEMRSVVIESPVATREQARTAWSSEVAA